MAFKVLFFVIFIAWTASALKCNSGVRNGDIRQEDCVSATHCVSFSSTNGPDFGSCDHFQMCQAKKPKTQPMGQTSEYKTNCCKTDLCNRF